ncbi:MAG: 6-hydroxymethylpterin diphosphokinase MptE-like protein [Arcobacter sp.]|uniref:6-hydroxymethylpterin diphosphokinase MptE-like protein n=1 Tax=Arcobacter sp. TaxID=1872629 RepID=UPI003C791AA4
MNSLVDFKDKYKGKRAFIVATGPSLKVEDLDFLEDEITLSCNKIFLAFNETEWRPTFYSIIDRLVSSELKEKINGIDSTKIFSSVCKKDIKDDSIYWLNDLPSPVVDNKRISKFSTDINYGTYGGYSVVYTLMQIAYYIGITELYLIGLDFSFIKSKETGDKTSSNEIILKQDAEVNHFHKDYRPTGSKWTEPRLDIQYDAFNCAKEAFENDGRKIFNASRKTALDVFECISFDNLFKERMYDK